MDCMGLKTNISFINIVNFARNCIIYIIFNTSLIHKGFICYFDPAIGHLQGAH